MVRDAHMRRKRFYEGRTSAKPFGRFTAHCNKHNATFATHDFCHECERERYLANPAPPPAPPEKSQAEKDRLARIRELAGSMAGKAGG